MTLSKRPIEHAHDRLNEIGYGAEGTTGSYRIYKLSDPENTIEEFKKMQQVYDREIELFDMANGTVNEVKIRYEKREYSFTDEIISSQRAESFFRTIWDKDMIDLKEQMYVVFLNGQKKIVGYNLVSTGSDCATIVDPKEIIRLALLTGCHSFIMAHNHPSGNTSESRADIKLTRRVKECADLFQIAVNDHIILAGNDYVSFRDKGLL